ncbi:hypothetical protein ACFL6B_03470 [Thermodesulfobacteriota bacterium]
MPRNILIIGAVAMGPKAACRFKRLEPNSRVIMLDQMGAKQIHNIIRWGGSSEKSGA